MQIKRLSWLLLLLLWRWCAWYKPGMNPGSRRQRQGWRQLRCQHCVSDVCPTDPSRRWRTHPSQPSLTTCDDLSPDFAAAAVYTVSPALAWEYGDWGLLDMCWGYQKTDKKVVMNCLNMATGTSQKAWQMTFIEDLQEMNATWRQAKKVSKDRYQ